ncbi:MAG: hypothetical protein EXQ70_00785 [Solirubrobacterales bacterium]|nr:hypothetical protein [Solirubrobacterales bacterium]
MKFSRLGRGEITAGIAGIALIIVMFFPWFAGFGGVETETTQVAPGVEVNTPTSIDNDVSAWDSLQDLDGFLIALAGVTGIALAGFTAGGRRVTLSGFQHGSVTLWLGVLATLIILWRMLANPGDLKIGIFLGLLAAAGVAAGGFRALQDSGINAVETVPGGRTKPAASRSGTAAKPRAKPAAKRSSSSRASASKPAARKTTSRAKSSTTRKRSS